MNKSLIFGALIKDVNLFHKICFKLFPCKSLEDQGEFIGFTEENKNLKGEEKGDEDDENEGDNEDDYFDFLKEGKEIKETKYELKLFEFHGKQNEQNDYGIFFSRGAIILKEYVLDDQQSKIINYPFDEDIKKFKKYLKINFPELIYQTFIVSSEDY